jgi:glycosyltransferase involved in cell wall biosynthesis
MNTETSLNEKESATPFISVIIPNYNGGKTIGKCLEAATASHYENFEVIVVDDCSKDNSVEIIKRFPCKLIQLPEHSGASKARNTGAENSKGEILFFIDSDCLLKKDTLSIAARTFKKHSNALIGGTYTPLPHDRNFFSIFQSIFINYSETKNKEPDYIATHAMLISAKLFKESGGFREDFLPILEDVEFSHRLKKKGIRLVMEPELVVEHIFNFSLLRSLKNAIRKSMYWTVYSIKNKDLLRDSGTASIELKVNTFSCFLLVVLLVLFITTDNTGFMLTALVVFAFNLFVNRHFIKAILNAAGVSFTIKALLYYTTLYPLAVGTGGTLGILKAIRK